jgi:hypothetical protein
MTYKKNPKNPNEFICEECNFKCCNKKDYNRHLSTRKHKLLTNTYNEVQKKPDSYVCECGKSYKHRQSLYSHRAKCNFQQQEQQQQTPKEENTPKDDDKDKVI